MTEREPEESSQPRKRIAVACGRCRKRKIRCSGDPGNGGPCSNCKNAGHEPCLFLRVSSTETHLRNDHTGSFGYDVDSTRGYSSRSAGSPLTAQYSPDVPGDIRYGQSAYPSYGNKYYTAVSGWSGAYGDDGVDYSINYSYPHISQDPVHMLPGYRYPSSGSSKTSIYAEPEAAPYNYGSLVHRSGPAVSDLPNFSLSGMAASLPTPAAAAERLPARTLASSTGYRGDGLPSHYSSSKTSSAQDAGYSSLNSSFDSPVQYGPPSATLPSSRTGSQSEASGYQSAGSEGVYGPSEHASYRSLHESDSYIYSDKLDSSRRGSQSSGSVLSNGQIYVPEPHAHHHGGSSHGFAIVPSVAHAAADTGATASGGGGSATSDAHRRSAGNVRVA